MAQDYNLDNISVNLENFSLKRHFYYIFDDDDNDDDDDDKERRTTTKMTKFKATATKKNYIQICISSVWLLFYTHMHMHMQVYKI